MHARARFIAMVGIAAFAGCGAAPPSAPGAARAEAAPVEQPSQRRLGAGESVRVEAAGLEIAFTKVAADSRCPRGERCIWEGSATVHLDVTGADGRRELVLHTSTGSGPVAAPYGAWWIRLVSLEPYPVSGGVIEARAYVATLQVDHGDTDPESGTPTR